MRSRSSFSRLIPATLVALVLAACQETPLEPPGPDPAGRVGGLNPASATTPVFYGTTIPVGQGQSYLYRIDPSTGAATLVGKIRGYNRVGAVEWHLATGTLYGTAQTKTGTPVLITIDPVTAKGRLVGPTGITGAISDLAFRSDGTLFVYDASNDPAHTMFTMNRATGAATLLGETGLGSNGGNGIAFGADGVLYHDNRTNAHTISQTDGSATVISPWNAGRALKAADLDPGTGMIYAIQGGSGKGGERLVIAHYATGTVTDIGATEFGMDGLTVGPTCASWRDALLNEIGTFGIPAGAQLTISGFVALVGPGDVQAVNALKGHLYFLQLFGVITKDQTKPFLAFGEFCLS